MIDYIEIRNASRELIGIIDSAASVIWHSEYYGTGDFEIYTSCTPVTATLLSVGNFVTRPDDRNIGIIESIKITNDTENGIMIAASGRFAKSILNRRVIYNLSGNSVSPRILKGNVEDAARALVAENAITCDFDSARNIPFLALGASSGSTKVIVDDGGDTSEKQVTYKILLDFISSLLMEYGMGSYISLDALTKNLLFNVFEGNDRSIDNTAGNNPVIFSQDFDNLLSSDYVKNVTTEKNTAIVGGAGEGQDRFVTVYKNSSLTGINRREVFVDSSSTSKTYKADDGTEATLTDEEYEKQLISIGRQNVASLSLVEDFEAEIDMTRGSWKYGVDADFYLGDIVSVQDVGLGLYMNPRLIGVVETQDDDGYKITGEFGA